MKRLVALTMTLLLAPAAAQGATQLTDPLAFHEPKAPKHGRMSLRIVDDARDPQPKPIRRSGMIAEREVLPNTTVGIGILKVSKGKVGSTDWRIDSRSTGTKRPALTVQFRF